MSNVLECEVRETKFSGGELNKFRKGGKIPGVIFGKGMDSVTVFVNLIEFNNMYAKNGKIFEVNFGGQKETVNAKVIDTTPLGRVNHISFHKLTKGEKTTVKIPVSIEGDAIGAKVGGIIQQLEDTIQITALPKDLPESIVVDVTALEIGQGLTVGQLNLSSKFEVDELDLERMIVNCQAPQKAAEEIASEDSEASAQGDSAPAAEESAEAKSDES